MRPSDEVMNEEEKRKARAEDLARVKQQAQDAQDAVGTFDKEHLEQQQADHNERIAAAKAFDWDAWEKETGLKRPEIG